MDNTIIRNLQAVRNFGVLRFAVVLLAAALLGLHAGPGRAAGPVLNPYAYPTPPGVDRAAVYFELHNNSGGPLVLNGATAAGVAEVQIHRHQHTDGMMGMRQQSHVEVGAGKTLSFAPGAFHLMLLGLERPLRVGESIHLQLQFAGDETLPVTAPVIELGSQPRSTGHGAMQHGMGEGGH